ncbi:MAG: sigma-54-dependent transcriptional regulator [bacterium]
MSKTKILIADDDKNIRFAFRKTFEQDGFVVLLAGDGNEALDKVATEKPTLVFLDITMPVKSGLEVLQEMREKGLNIPVVVITGYGTMQTAVKAVQLGAYEYLTKPLDVDKVRVVARRVLEMVRLRKEVEDLKAQLHRPVREFELIGNDPQMQEVYKKIGSVTTTPNATNVLIVGESGTGKELVARAIHNSGTFSREPFVAINCTVLPETLLESELFGHEKGAFTGADKRKLGKFEVAKQGTIYLDEIGDMSPKLQQKLLRVLQERVFERLGGNEPIEVKARFIASTNRDLEREIRLGCFREDLFFRLNVINIELPPLRVRRADIPVLANHFLVKYNRRLHKDLKGISQEAMALLNRYPFPGNVRELENAIEHSVALEKGEVLLPESLPPQLRTQPNDQVLDIPVTSPILHEARKAVVEAFEKKFLVERLRCHRGNVTAAAKEAQIQRQSFQRLMKKYDIDSSEFR